MIDISLRIYSVDMDRCRFVTQKWLIFLKQSYFLDIKDFGEMVFGINVFPKDNKEHQIFKEKLFKFFKLRKMIFQVIFTSEELIIASNTDEGIELLYRKLVEKIGLRVKF